MYRLIFIVLLLAFQSLNAQTTENVIFESGDLTLIGTVYTPDGEGPFPVVVIVHGSGPTNRNGLVNIVGPVNQCLYPELVNQQFNPYSDIAEHLSSRGIMVFSYDKRTATHPALLNPVTVTPYDFIDDVHSAIDFIKLREGADQDCIVLAGHSQGAGFIPIVAQERNDITGLISLAGTTQAIDTVVAEQNLKAYRDCFGLEDEGLQIQMDLLNTFAAVRAGNFGLNQPIEVLFPGQAQLTNLGFPTFWLDWIEITESVVDNYLAANKSTLIIHGDDDFNVDHEDSNELSEALLGSITETHIYPDVNHFFTDGTTVDISEEILLDIENWILNVKEEVVSTQNINKDDPSIKISNTQDLIKVEVIAGDYEELVIYDLNGRLLRSIAIKDKNEIIIDKLDAQGMVIFNFLGEVQMSSRKVFSK